MSQLKITEQERSRRKASIEAAQGSVRLEGFILDEDIRALNQQFIDGELTREELGVAVRTAVDAFQVVSS